MKYFSIFNNFHFPRSHGIDMKMKKRETIPELETFCPSKRDVHMIYFKSARLIRAVRFRRCLFKGDSTELYGQKHHLTFI